ncbi:LPS export ABC transporter periplasmic protein LptC [Solitalea koreensis]|uniref:LPS export ABC transporter periplasmic protein LptC n=1 Tax=Solitalea koreensis TaxID=543615 RepID=UPI00163D3E1C|nr:LPS export ABC transporter periplasmic protein LptC [Solitalea koreensis]
MRKNFNWIIIGLGLCVIACSNDLDKVNTISAKIAEKPVERSKNVDLIFSDSAKVKAELKTPEYLQYKVQNPYDEMPKGLKIDFFSPDLLIESTLTAKYGIRRYNEQNIEVRDSVVVVNKNGKRLTTEQLIWDQPKHMIFSDKFVKITSPDGTVQQGYGMEANEDLSNIRIKKFSGELYYKEGSETP